MKKKAAPAFSRQTLDFILKATRAKKPEWLDKNRDEYERVLLEPLKHLATELKRELTPVARDYHFPQKGIGRLKRSARRAAEYGALFKDYVSYSASRPSESRFDHNPNLFFLIHPEDKDDPVLVAGGLYMPSSRQLRAIREAISRDASAFDQLFASKEFKRHFPEGFSLERTAKRAPKGFDPDHPRMEWLKLQGYFVWHRYSMKEFISKEFAAIVAADWRQIVKLNSLLDKAIQGTLPSAVATIKDTPSNLLDRLEGVRAPTHKWDF